MEQLPRALGLVGEDGQSREEEKSRLLELGMEYLERTSKLERDSPLRFSQITQRL